MIMNTNIPNKIKQTPLCCIYCGKGYKIGTNFNKHIILCELLIKSKSSKRLLIEDEDEIPSPKKLYKMLLELGYKYNKLEEKMNEMKISEIKEKKINIIEWLNTNKKPEYLFEKLIDKIIIQDSDIEILLNNTLNNTLNSIFSRNLYLTNDKKPIFAFIKKSNLFYIYDKINQQNQQSCEEGWIELTREKLIKFLNKIQQKISRKIFEWKQNHKEEIINDKFAIIYDKAIIKLMSVEFANDSTLNKIINIMYTQMKVNI
jgi:hypothetical protein